jgi:hypothetical protein
LFLYALAYAKNNPNKNNTEPITTNSNLLVVASSDAGRIKNIKIVK